MKDGYCLRKKFLDDSKIESIENILRKFHAAWLIKNEESYRHGAINSAYITNGEFLSAAERLELLKFVGSQSVVKLAKDFLGEDIRFLNTQLFFNPAHRDQKNYWHRDIQYTSMTEEQQCLEIESKQPSVVHLRLALANELGIEFVPQSHIRWDTTEELDVRLKRNARQAWDALPMTQTVAMERGDLLLFDANIIHRGLYGGDRLAFDILFCRPRGDILQFVDQSTYPTTSDLAFIECPDVYEEPFSK